MNPTRPNKGGVWGAYLPPDVLQILKSMTKSESGSAARYVAELVRADQAKGAKDLKSTFVITLSPKHLKMAKRAAKRFGYSVAESVQREAVAGLEAQQESLDLEAERDKRLAKLLR